MDHHDQAPPPVAAVFLVIFDQKVGYTIAWKRTRPDVALDGVEYKSLPSGLHTVKEDLVYFLHGPYAGISLFAQADADATHRHANFAAVGALVPRPHGHLGGCWTHAEELRCLAKEVVKNSSDTRPLEMFWDKHNSVSPTGNASKQSGHLTPDASVTAFDNEAAWPLDHPALHVPAMLELFGPLVFPLYRAALLRQRVLLMGSPSVQHNANTVYIASILAGIPQSLADVLPTDASSIMKSSPLFSVGIHDIPALAKTPTDRSGWIATTTDDILGDKTNLYDLLVELPPKSAPRRTWPKMRTSDGRPVKASQRDLRRWTLLRRELRRLRRQIVSRYADQSPGLDESDQRPLLERRGTNQDDFYDMGLQNRDETDAVEAPSWSAVAVRGLMWWASAGDVSAWENDEARADEELLFEMPDVGVLFPGTASERTQEDKESEYCRAAATLLVAYFRRVTEGILRPMTSMVEEADDSTEEGLEVDDIDLTGDDMRAMGLDTWSECDKAFARDMMKLVFNRTATISDSGVRVCGVRIY